ncbi:MAG: cytochrome oxidase small assembly protein [Betaproteobacteria bacterium]|jgi:hypothetical protein|nr:cytochrome oxidase small assembly protein [Burkholderiales bacterium]
MTPEQKKNNLKLGLILASTALLFFLGIVVKITFLTQS